ncbi:hypothetical protein ACFX13_025345 [Malus domestica]
MNIMLAKQHPSCSMRSSAFLHSNEEFSRPNLQVERPPECSCSPTAPSPPSVELDKVLENGVLKRVFSSSDSAAYSFVTMGAIAMA